MRFRLVASVFLLLVSFSGFSQEKIAELRLQFAATKAAAERADRLVDESTASPLLDITPIDISSFFAADSQRCAERAQVIAQVRRACQELGFFTIVGHGLPVSLINRVTEQANQFFAKARSEKEQLITSNTSTLRGWANPSQTEIGGDSKVKRVYKESFHVGPEAQPYDANLWPDDPDFKRGVLAYYAQMEGIERILMEIIALSLEQEPAFFAPTIAVHKGLLRFNFLDTRQIPQDTRSVSFGSHTDWGTITILHQEKPGLEVIFNERWHAIVSQPGELVVNLGDLMNIWSNGAYKSSIHRARHQNGETRISIPYFGGHSLHPAADVVVRPIVGEKDAVNFPATTFHEYLRARYQYFEEVTRV